MLKPDFSLQCLAPNKIYKAPNIKFKLTTVKNLCCKYKQNKCKTYSEIYTTDAWGLDCLNAYKMLNSIGNKQPRKQTIKPSLRSQPRSILTSRTYALPVLPLGKLPKRLGPQIKVNKGLIVASAASSFGLSLSLLSQNSMVRKQY